MRIGIAGLQGADELTLARLLAQPLRTVEQPAAGASA